MRVWSIGCSYHQKPIRFQLRRPANGWRMDTIGRESKVSIVPATPLTFQFDFCCICSSRDEPNKQIKGWVLQIWFACSPRTASVECKQSRYSHYGLLFCVFFAFGAIWIIYAVEKKRLAWKSAWSNCVEQFQIFFFVYVLLFNVYYSLIDCLTLRMHTAHCIFMQLKWEKRYCVLMTVR